MRRVLKFYTLFVWLVVVISALPFAVFAQKKACHLTGMWQDTKSDTRYSFWQEGTENPRISGYWNHDVSVCGQTSISGVLESTGLVLKATHANRITCPYQVEWRGKFTSPNCDHVTGLAVTDNGHAYPFAWSKKNTAWLVITEPDPGSTLSITEEPAMPFFKAVVASTKLCRQSTQL